MLRRCVFGQGSSVRASGRRFYRESFERTPGTQIYGKRSTAHIVRGANAPIVSRFSSSIADLQAAKVFRNQQFANLQIRKLAFSTRMGFWLRKNFTTLAHLTCLSIGAWVLLDTTQSISVLLLGISALNLHKWLTLVLGSAIGYQLSADVTVGKVIPKWTVSEVKKNFTETDHLQKKGTIRIVDMKIKREKEYARKINGAAMDMNIAEIDVKLSLSHALAGEGILSEISISGLTGTLDRRTTVWTEAMEAAHQKREATENDFHLDYVKVKDLALTIHQNCPDRPLDLTIFSLKLRRLRQHWLLLDLFDAEAGHGKFDDCLFSVENVEVDYKTQTRTNHFKIDGLDFDLVSSSYPKGILSWITQGFMDIDCFYKFPLYTIDEKATRYNPKLESKIVDYNTKFDMALSLNNINISLPNVTSNDISITNYAMVQPIVAYFNTNYVKVPLQLHFVLPMDDFCGSWYPGEANLYSAISNSSYDDVLRLMAEQKKYRRARELLMMGIGGCYRGTKYYLSQTWYYIKEHV